MPTLVSFHQSRTIERRSSGAAAIVLSSSRGQQQCQQVNQRKRQHRGVSRLATAVTRGYREIAIGEHNLNFGLCVSLHPCTRSDPLELRQS